MLMNGTEIGEATNAEQSSLLIALTAPFFTQKQRVETLFLATVARQPTDEEAKAMIGLLDEAGKEERLVALGDILWAILNSSEFALNH